MTKKRKKKEKKIYTYLQTHMHTSTHAQTHTSTPAYTRISGCVRARTRMYTSIVSRGWRQRDAEKYH